MILTFEIVAELKSVFKSVKKDPKLVKNGRIKKKRIVKLKKLERIKVNFDAHSYEKPKLPTFRMRLLVIVHCDIVHKL